MTQCMELVLISAFLMGADTDDAVKKEQARFAGVWSFALVEVDGKKQPEAPFETNKVIISKDGSFVVVQGQRITRGIMTLDPTKTPKLFDVTITHGPAKGRKTLAVYELDDNSYKVCSSFRSKERPAALESKPGAGMVYQLLKREKQDVQRALIEVGRKELAGTWQAVSYALDGVPAPDEDMKKVQLVFDAAGKTAARREGKVFIASTTTIDPAADPMTMDITFTEGDLKGRTALGIYKIDDGVLTICRAGPDKPRPTQFASKPGSGHTLMTYKREAHSTK